MPSLVGTRLIVLSGEHHQPDRLGAAACHAEHPPVHEPPIAAAIAASYVRAASGDDAFRVQAAGSDGVWNEEGAALAITIMRPPWKTGWAYSVYGLMAVGLRYGLRKYEMNRLRLKTRLQMENISQLCLSAF